MHVIDVLIAMQWVDGDDVCVEVWMHSVITSMVFECDPINCWFWLMKWESS